MTSAESLGEKGTSEVAQEKFCDLRSCSWSGGRWLGGHLQAQGLRWVTAKVSRVLAADPVCRAPHRRVLGSCITRLEDALTEPTEQS